ncbi:MAG TPA: amidohydrolase family protein [Vicinamibacteria bacterium]|nr:amidohydrolase family protein [Vicinamibacteria bacterium]
MKRREFLGVVGALSASSVGSGAESSRKIDIHNHYYPETYFRMISEMGGEDYTFDTDAAGTRIIKFRGARFFGIQPPMTDVSLRLQAMDRTGIDVQVLSVSVPNVYFADEASEPLIARRLNDSYAELIATHPTRFKGFASIPMDVPDAALAELDRALGELKLNGVILLSHIRGKPLTEPRFRPFFEEANRRELCIIIHPMMPSGMAEQLQDYVLGPIVGFLFDSSLAVARMCYDGLFRDFPRIRWIIPHLGGAIPYWMARLDRGYHDFVACREKIDRPPSTYLKKLYYGTVSSSPETLGLVRDLVGTDHIALGTDYPHLLGSIEETLLTIGSLRIPDSEKDQIYHATALRILNNV